MHDRSRSFTRRRVLGATAGAAAALGTASIATAQAAEPLGSRSASSTGSLDPAKGLPSAVHPVSGVNAQTPGSGPTWIDSIYFTSQLEIDGHDFGLLVATGRLPGNGGSVTVTATDQVSGWHKSHQALVTEDDYTWDTGTLDIKAPTLTWTGDAQKMSVQATADWGSADLRLERQGPALVYLGSGVWPMLGATQYEFAHPSMRTTGTVTIEGKKHQVSGESWLDRQWGSLPTSKWRWTWMNISLSNGDKIALWDILDDKNENAFATVLHPDGSYDLAAVRPVAEGARRIWTSPTSGNAYPTRWRVEIPSLDTRLDVRVTGTEQQELDGHGIPARMDITAAVAGIHEGKRVTGKTYVEMVGSWKA
ncbi:lipocalin family protein [Streptomyces justiciae]|uniref:lipocalin family protein n=1 Tax=Streptomyces justiciae TaxID=2780140 RepID=UPI002118BCD3|nr:lipocalin family protein [Streptomyces justiciae]MCW8379698.1 hypothetical protein [Streptomyces justiciae]